LPWKTTTLCCITSITKLVVCSIPLGLLHKYTVSLTLEELWPTQATVRSEVRTYLINLWCSWIQNTHPYGEVLLEPFVLLIHTLMVKHFLFPPWKQLRDRMLLARCTLQIVSWTTDAKLTEQRGITLHNSWWLSHATRSRVVQSLARKKVEM